MQRYRELLKRPYVPRVVALAFAERIPVASQALALLLLVHAATGSYATAGAVSAANVLSAGAVAPVQGRLMDRLGQTRVLVPCAVANGLLLCALAALALRHAPATLLLIGAALAGGLRPALSPAMQVLWPGLAGGEEPARAAFALEATMVELSFVFGPLLAAAIGAAASPAAAVMAAGALTMLGTLGFAATPPSRRWRPVATAAKSSGGALACPGIRTIALVALPAGIALGSIEVALPAFAGHHGAAELGGLLLAAVAVGSTTGGLWYGARSSPASLSQRWLRLNVLLALALVPLSLAWDLPIMVVACVVAGSGFAPLMSASWGLIAHLAPHGHATDANAWYQSAIIGGTALGAAAGGAVVERIGLQAALVAPCLAVALAACVAAARRRTLAPAPVPA